MPLRPFSFIDTEIEVEFIRHPVLRKKTGCPDAFTWQDHTFRIESLLREWHDYQRRGRFARNMRPDHARQASRRGSWGVGRDYYRVRPDTGRFFDLYYDRKPTGTDDRGGQWVLLQELTE